MASQPTAISFARSEYGVCEVLEGGGSIENLDRTARRFLETFREMTK